MPIEEIIEMEGMEHTNWKLVVFAADCGCDLDCNECEDCEELRCHVCGDRYADCPCPGPTQDGIEYMEKGGILYGREEQPQRRETDGT